MRWVRGGTSALLGLPSVIVHEETVVLINPAHPDARKVTAKTVRKFEYDLLLRGKPHAAEARVYLASHPYKRGVSPIGRAFTSLPKVHRLTFLQLRRRVQ